MQLDGGEIEARDHKKFVDEILETVGLVERDGEVFLPQRRGDLALVVQQRQIPDHGRERRFEIVRKIHDEIVFSLLGFAPRPEIFLRA